METIKTVMCAAICAVCSLGVTPTSAAPVDFEEFGAPPYSLAAESYWNGSDGSGGFTSAGASFNNSYTDYGAFYSWSGWSVSNVTDNTTPGYDNQFSAFPGSGSGGSEFYGVSYVSTFAPAPRIDVPVGAAVESMQITNATFAALSMRHGDAYAKQFGGQTGDDPDWFRLTITGLDEIGTPIGDVEFYLADYRFDDNDVDYIIGDWASVDLTAIGDARSLTFALDSSDVGQHGMNTPAYFAMDNLTFVPEPATAGLLLLVGVCLSRRRVILRRVRGM